MHAGVLLKVWLWVGQLEHELSPEELDSWWWAEYCLLFSSLDPEDEMRVQAVASCPVLQGLLSLFSPALLRSAAIARMSAPTTVRAAVWSRQRTTLVWITCDGSRCAPCYGSRCGSLGGL